MFVDNGDKLLVVVNMPGKKEMIKHSHFQYSRCFVFCYNDPVFRKSNQQRLAWVHILDVFLNVVIIVVIVGGIRTFLVSPFQVEGSSMVPTLEDNQYIIINKLAYHIGHPNRGDIVVFHPPDDKKKFYVKRVIGLPKDRVTLRGGQVFIREADSDREIRLDERTYLDERNLGSTYRHPPGSGDFSETDFMVPEGHYFLLGDNRQGSLDSRSFMNREGEHMPFVSNEAISGYVWFIALPVTKIHAFEPPEYGL